MNRKTTENKDVTVTLRVTDITIVCMAALSAVRDGSSDDKFDCYLQVSAAVGRMQHEMLSAPLIERVADATE